MTIWVDADACPVVIKEMLYRAAERTRMPLVLVANQSLRTPPSAVIRSVLESKQARLSAALVRPGSGLADEPLDRVFGALPRDVDFATSLDPDVRCDVLVDFSGPVAFDAALALALQRRAGFVSGTIIRIHTRDFDYKGHTHHATENDPQYEIKSDKTDHIAAHRGAVLRKAKR